jgi:hypothetical protein
MTVDLRAGDARGGDARSVDARSADIRSGDARGVDLRGVDLRGGDLGGDLRGGDLGGEARAAAQPKASQPATRSNFSAAIAAPTIQAQSAVVETPRPTRTAPNLFDSVWPADEKPRPQFSKESVARELKPEPAAIPRERTEPVIVARPAADEAPPSRARNEPRPVSILKSGIIDGMAYTLYTDGSIEAQLSQNTMRFSSIDELRDHLESGT